MTEAMVNSMFDDASVCMGFINNNVRQVIKDTFIPGYDVDNDGNSNYSKSVESRVLFPDVLVWEDDFMEAAAALASTVYSKAHWTGGGTLGTQAVIAGINGIMQLDTTATGSRSSTLTLTSANLDTLYAPKVEFCVNVSSITNSNVKVGLYASAND